MSFVKRGDAEVVHVFKKTEGVNDNETQKVLEAAKQDAKNISKDGNKSESAGNKNE